MTVELAPMGWTNFVLANPSERGQDGQTPAVFWTPERARQLGEMVLAGTGHSMIQNQPIGSETGQYRRD